MRHFARSGDSAGGYSDDPMKTRATDGRVAQATQSAMTRASLLLFHLLCRSAARRPDRRATEGSRDAAVSSHGALGLPPGQWPGGTGGSPVLPSKDGASYEMTGPSGEGRAFKLIEVMIAAAIFFVGMFALLGVLSTGLHAASILQKNSPTAGMAIALSGITLTNQLEEAPITGDFGEIYPDYRFMVYPHEILTNGLFQV